MAMKTVTTLSLFFFIIFFFFSTSSASFSKSFYHTKFVSLSDNTSAAHHLFTLTRRPHVAGTQANAETASYVLSTLISNQIPNSHFASYKVSLTYPVSRSLTLTVVTNQSSSSTKQFSLRQQIYNGDPYADVANQILPTFHAYAKSGSASGPAVYANYGRVQDFETLKETGVNVSGNVVLARYGAIFRGDIVQNAQKAGAIGVIIYTDRKDYGGGGTGRGFPEDKWMPPSGVQVGSVYKGTGDPTTTGWASVEGCERLTAEEVEKSGDVPLIPSLPVSWADGEVILNSINGPVANGDWQGGAGGNASVYRLGPGPGIIHLNYQGKEVIRAIHNVIGIIEGSEEPDRYVLIGNHRDAWTFGAVDPSSGTAAMLEIAERLGKLQKQGWKPRRTIVICSWDAEEYGLIGSTEWVEENRETLTSRAVAYLNVDVAVYGVGFQASATPQLDELLVQASKLVPDPNNSSQTVYDAWLQSKSKAVLGRLGGGGSDYKAFVQHIGVPAADMNFGEGGYSVYHSMYDDFVWMKNFGDPMFKRHVAVASVWGLVALRLADDEILPFNYQHYGDALQKSAEELKVELVDKDINLKPLVNSIDELKLSAIKINDQKEEVYRERKTKKYYGKARELNDRLMMAERAFTDRDGLPSRPWFKHLIYAPSRNNGYGSKSFPGIYDAIDMAKTMNTEEGWKSVQHEVWRVSRAIKHASLVLKGELT